MKNDFLLKNSLFYYHHIYKYLLAFQNKQKKHPTHHEPDVLTLNTMNICMTNFLKGLLII
jgi:hypothetical protein